MYIVGQLNAYRKAKQGVVVIIDSTQFWVDDPVDGVTDLVGRLVAIRAYIDGRGAVRPIGGVVSVDQLLQGAHHDIGGSH